MTHSKKRPSRKSSHGSVADAAQEVLRDRYKTLLTLMTETVKSDIDNRETIHKLRVAARRATAAIEFYESWLPKHRTKKLYHHCHRAREAAGESRDLDVLLEYVAVNARQIPPDVFVWLTRHAAFRRCITQKDLQREMKQLLKKKTAKQADSLFSKAHWRGVGDEPTFKAHAALVLQELVEALARQQKKILRHSRELHVLRVLCKRVRYTLDLLHGTLPHSLAASLKKRLSAIQDRLGRLNDAAMVIERLKAWQGDCREKSVAKLLQRVTDREVETMAEKVALAVENMPHEIAPLVTMLRQLAPAA